MPTYQIEYEVKSSRIAIIEAETKEEARDKWCDDDWIEDYEQDSDHEIYNIERIDD